MKNRLSLNRPLLKTALFSTLALTCVTALAQNGPTVVFMEDPTSPQGLTAQLLGGVPVGFVTQLTPAGAPIQMWDWSPGAPFTVTGPQPLSWIEPGTPAGVAQTYNVLQPANSTLGPPALLITSDTLQGGFTAVSTLNDGDTFNNWLTWGGTSYGVQFKDLGDLPSSTVPDGSLHSHAVRRRAYTGRRCGP